MHYKKKKKKLYKNLLNEETNKYTWIFMNYSIKACVKIFFQLNKIFSSVGVGKHQ